MNGTDCLPAQAQLSLQRELRVLPRSDLAITDGRYRSVTWTKLYTAAKVRKKAQIWYRST